MCLNDAGTVAFNSTLINGGAVTTRERQRPVDRHPREPHAGRARRRRRSRQRWTDLRPLQRERLPERGGAGVVPNALSGGANAQSIYSWDPVLGLQPVFFPNDSVEVQPGVFKTLVSVSSSPISNGQSRALSFANDGTVTLRPSFTDGSFGIVTIRIGSLTALPKKISEATGGTQKLHLQAGSAHAGQLYAIAGSASGTNPGTPIGAFIVPLNLDSYTDFTLANANVGPYVNTVGNARRRRPRPGADRGASAAGLRRVVVHHAYGVLDSFNNLVFVSEPARLEITP